MRELTQLDAAINAAFAAALINPERVVSAIIAENTTLQTDTYAAPAGSGFRVVCRVKVPRANYVATKIRNHGPDTESEQDWPSEGIEAAAQAHVLRCIQAGADYVNNSGFDADKKVILLNRLLKSKEDGSVASRPKLVDLYEWFEQIEELAVSGRAMYFQRPPHTFEEVISE